MKTSSGAGSCSSTAATASGIAPRWTGMLSAWVTMRPRSSKSAVEESRRSLMLGENAAERHGQLERLAGVAEISLALGGKLSRRGQRHDVGAHADPALVARDEAECAEHACGLRHEHGSELELLGERARMETAGAA